MPYIKVIDGPKLENRHIAVRVSVWHDQASHDADDPAFFSDVFFFGRDNALRNHIVGDTDGWPMLAPAPGTRAPSRSLAEARQQALSDNPTLGVIKHLTDGLPENFATYAEVIAARDALIEVLKDDYLGQPYLPDGESWLREDSPTLDVPKMKAVIQRRYDREVQHRQAVQDIFDNDPDIQEMSGWEGTI